MKENIYSTLVLPALKRNYEKIYDIASSLDSFDTNETIFSNRDFCHEQLERLLRAHKNIKEVSSILEQLDANNYHKKILNRKEAQAIDNLALWHFLVLGSLANMKSFFYIYNTSKEKEVKDIALVSMVTSSTIILYNVKKILTILSELKIKGVPSE